METFYPCICVQKVLFARYCLLVNIHTSMRTLAPCAYLADDMDLSQVFLVHTAHSVRLIFLTIAQS